MGKADGIVVTKTAPCLLNKLSDAPDHGGTGGQQDTVKGRLLRGSTVSGSMDRGPHPQSLVEWRIITHRVAPVAHDLGSRLAGCGLAGIRLLVMPLAIKTPTRGHTSAARL